MVQPAEDLESWMATPDDLDSDEFTDLSNDSELDSLDDIPLAEDEDKEDDVADVDFDADEDEDSDEDEDGARTSGDDSDEELDGDEEPDEEEESLDVILAREQDLEDEFARTGEGGRTSPTSTPAGDDEFTCRSCFLVKRRAQLAEDEDELTCLDCA